MGYRVEWNLEDGWFNKVLLIVFDYFILRYIGVCVICYRIKSVECLLVFGVLIFEDKYIKVSLFFLKCLF